MFATMQLLFSLGSGRFALVADMVLTGAALAGCAVVVARARRPRPPVIAAADPAADVLAEAEAVVTSIDDREPA